MNNTRFSDISVPAGLEARILADIERASRRRVRARIAAAFFAFAASAALSVEFFIYLGSELSKSGFFSYLSLLWSDSKIVAGDFGAYALSVVNSTPFLAITLFGLSVLALLVSARFIATMSRGFMFDRTAMLK